MQKERWIPLCGIIIPFLFLIFDPALLPLIFCVGVAQIVNGLVARTFPDEIVSISFLFEIVLVLVVPVIEEHLFRWWLPTLLIQFTTSGVCIIVTLAFSLSHLSGFQCFSANQSRKYLVCAQVCYALLFGLFLPLLDLRRSILMHVFFNASAVIGYHYWSYKYDNLNSDDRCFFMINRSASSPSLRLFAESNLPHLKTNRPHLKTYSIPSNLKKSNDALQKFMSDRNHLVLGQKSFSKLIQKKI